MTIKKYTKTEIKDPGENNLTRKVEALMHEIKTKFSTSLNINLNSTTNYSSDNRFELKINGYNNVDGLLEINNIFLSEPLLNDLLTILYHHKEKTLQYTKELKNITMEFDGGLLSKNQFLEKTRELKIKYKMIS